MIGERMARHGFVDRPAATAVAAAAHTIGLQAQDAAAARLGVRARSSAVTETDVLTAIAERHVVRTWLMRNTIHLVAADDLRWLVALFGPMIRRRFETKRWPALGLSPAVLERAAAVTPEVLAGGPLTRSDFGAALAARGLTLGPDPQALVHVLVFLATHGLTCHADGDRFALLDDWVPPGPTPSGDDALAELARRWFAAFSPATGADFTAWSGLPSSHAIALIRDELTAVDVYGRAGFRLGEPVDAEPTVRLLGAFDNYLIGYRERGPIIDAEHRDTVYVGGIIRPTVVRDGQVIGRWRQVRPTSVRKPINIEIGLFGAAGRGVRAAIDAEVADLGRFLGRETVPAQLPA